MTLIELEPGDLKHSIAIQAPTDGQDASGGPTQTFATVETVWGHVRPLVGRQLLEAQQISSDVTHEVRMWSNTTVTRKHQLLLESGRILHVASVIDEHEEGVATRLMCKESV